MVILILGNDRDEHAGHMLRYLRTQGADAEFLDGSGFPAELAVSFDPTTRTGLFRLPGGRKLTFDQIGSVYWRCFNPVPYPGLPDAEQSYIAQNDARSLFESVLIDLPARWVNGWRAYQLHQTKPVQLGMVAALGIPVPATVLTNDPEAVLEFAARHPRAIFKPVQGGAHTMAIAARHLTPENLKSLTIAPVTLQEEVPGTNVRVFVAGQRVMACEIATGELDFRDDPDPRIDPMPLPPDIQDQCIQIARALDLLWTGIDLRRAPDGRFVFLEANPSPMFLGFEQRTGLPLTESLAALLV
jgi:hypothetical protein